MPTITGTDGTDILSGGGEADEIFGLGGNDQLTGNGGNDTIDGGAGDDILTGSSGSDVLTGGSGADAFRDTMAGLNGDRITDLLPGDRIQITDLSIQNAQIGITGSSITFNGNTLAVDNLGPGRLIVREIQGGGVEIRLQGIAENDFNGDGRSDILWRHDDGRMTNWLGLSNGGFQDNAANAMTSVPNSWHVVGTGDFNGDGRADILWRNDDGRTTNWLGLANGGYQDNANASMVFVPNSWQVAGVGDINGDGRDDIIWRNTDGRTTNWLGLANGGYFDNAGPSSTFVPTSWQIAGVGDINGDGRDDLIWRNSDGRTTNWLGLANGGYFDNANASSTFVPTSWHIAGVGDINGDGRDDLVWRNDDGRTTNWLGLANGGYFDNANASSTFVPTSWQIAAIGDYNGDGRDDILWRNSDGRMTDWLGLANGGYFDNAGASSTSVPTAWHVQPDALWP